ncbi:hypothetical protein [Moritella sp. F3]|uniref:hypothetical protein n=1 Tax=Moritella sp. F3 TaxID=2718882 RepID=UPI0018E0E68A|nr:hypothetical protein [Moritella sp. F3]GIC77267.1 hypothetical protein FMO001_19940 [Moritella sp. F1]GIC83205.1 hypothetical protein FMO003_34850 [Moritella sp. F3]
MKEIKLRSFSLVLIVQAFILLMAWQLSHLLPFYERISPRIIIIYFFDFTFLLFLLYVFFYFNKFYYKGINVFFENTLRRLVEDNILLIFIVFLFILLESIPRIPLVLSGVSREDLVFEFGRSRFIMFITMPILILTGISIVFSYSYKIRFLLIASFFLLVIYSLSRSEILKLIYIIMVIIPFGSDKKIYLKMFFLMLLLALLGAVSTIYQGRSVTIISAAVNMSESLFKYTTFSMYLGDLVIDKFEHDYEKILFPFFGFFSERFLSLFSSLDNPVGVNNSRFVSEFILLGYSNALSANVVYPWNTWFYAMYGSIGIIIKAIYTYLLLHFTFRCKLFITHVFFLFSFLVTQFSKHPFINNDAAYLVVSCLFLDVFIKYFKNKKLRY